MSNASQPKSHRRPSWQSGPFSEGDTDPMLGFANIMDVMLVFALGLMLALVAQSQELQQHLNLDREHLDTEQVVHSGKELAELPESLQSQSAGAGMQALGKVYRDPQTGKLILVGGE